MSSSGYALLPGLLKFAGNGSTVSCDKSSQCRILKHASSLEPSIMTTHAVICTVYQLANEWHSCHSSLPAGCISRCRCLLYLAGIHFLKVSDATFAHSPPGHASFHAHTTVMTTVVFLLQYCIVKSYACFPIVDFDWTQSHDCVACRRVIVSVFS